MESRSVWYRKLLFILIDYIISRVGIMNCVRWIVRGLQKANQVGMGTHGDRNKYPKFPCWPPFSLILLTAQSGHPLRPSHSEPAQLSQKPVCPYTTLSKWQHVWCVSFRMLLWCIPKQPTHCAPHRFAGLCSYWDFRYILILYNLYSFVSPFRRWHYIACSCYKTPCCTRVQVIDCNSNSNNSKLTGDFARQANNTLVLQNLASHCNQWWKAQWRGSAVFCLWHT